MREADDAFQAGDTVEPDYPTVIRNAGVIWIVWGSLILVNLVVAYILTDGFAGIPGGTCPGLLAGLFGAVFIHVGVQSVRGTAKDTLGNGIGSIVFGLLNLAVGVAHIIRGNILEVSISFVVGAGLLTAGILALAGRSDYRAWRKAEKLRRTTSVRPPREDAQS